jgi:hypothetical protein
MVPYRYQNKKAFPVDRISSHRHTFFTIDIMAELLTQTSARNGSTKIGSSHGLRRCPAHEASPLHYEAIANIEHAALLPNG